MTNRAIVVVECSLFFRICQTIRSRVSVHSVYGGHTLDWSVTWQMAMSPKRDYKCFIKTHEVTLVVIYHFDGPKAISQLHEFSTRSFFFTFVREGEEKKNGRKRNLRMIQLDGRNGKTFMFSFCPKVRLMLRLGLQFEWNVNLPFGQIYCYRPWNWPTSVRIRWNISFTSGWRDNPSRVRVNRNLTSCRV